MSCRLRLGNSFFSSFFGRWNYNLFWVEVVKWKESYPFTVHVYVLSGRQIHMALITGLDNKGPPIPSDRFWRGAGGAWAVMRTNWIERHSTKLFLVGVNTIRFENISFCHAHSLIPVVVVYILGGREGKERKRMVIKKRVLSSSQGQMISVKLMYIPFHSIP